MTSIFLPFAFGYLLRSCVPVALDRWRGRAVVDRVSDLPSQSVLGGSLPCLLEQNGCDRGSDRKQGADDQG